MTTNTIHHPICAVCKRPAEQVASMEADDGDGVIIKVRCHGEREEHQLSRADMEHATSIEIGEVFRRSLPEGT